MSEIIKIEFKDGSSKEFETLRHANLRDANLSYANLSYANLINANLINADLRNADLEGANLRNANLRGADLRNADLRHADLIGANLRDANLSYANLDYSIWPLWCGTTSSSIKLCDKLKAQLLYHALIVQKSDKHLNNKEDMIEFIEKNFHRYSEVEQL